MGQGVGILLSVLPLSPRRKGEVGGSGGGEVMCPFVRELCGGGGGGGRRRTGEGGGSCSYALCCNRCMTVWVHDSLGMRLVCNDK